jgi:mevalonate kinase
MNQGFGYGKIILFGEHFVVHGLPAIVASLNLKTIATIKKIEGLQPIIIDNRPKHPKFKPSKTEEYETLLNNILEFLNIKENVQITLSGNLPVTSGGIGASAAASVSIARALNQLFEFNLTDEEINEAALQGEKGVHQNPSGIDNTASMFGGIFEFKKHDQRFTKKTINLKQPIKMVIADSGIISNTKQNIFDVQKLKTQDVKFTNKIFDEYEKIYQEAIKAIIDFDMPNLGKLMNKNHELLSAMGLSCNSLEKIIEISRKTGALGAKLTGGGKGGIAISLTPNQNLQNHVANELQRSFWIQRIALKT